LLKTALVAAALSVRPVSLSVKPVIRRLAGTPAGRLNVNGESPERMEPSAPPLLSS